MTARETKDHIAAERDALKAQLADLWQALEDEAQNRGWCSDYTEFAREHGGPVVEEKSVSFKLTVTYAVSAVVGEAASRSLVQENRDLQRFIIASLDRDALEIDPELLLDQDWLQGETGIIRTDLQVSHVEE